MGLNSINGVRIGSLIQVAANHESREMVQLKLVHTIRCRQSDDRIALSADHSNDLIHDGPVFLDRECRKRVAPRIDTLPCRATEKVRLRERRRTPLALLEEVVPTVIAGREI